MIDKSLFTLLVLIFSLGAFPAYSQATYVVTTTADSGPGSLRQAILDSNNGLECADSVITFSIASGAKTIRPISPLPTLSRASLDGRTQPGYSGMPLIEINGDLLAAGQSGLTAGGGACMVVVRALVANRAPKAGFFLLGSATLLSSYAGTDVAGTFARPNLIGVQLGFSPNIVIGGTGVGDGNVISGNNLGIDAYSRGAVITGNRIGTDRSGLLAVPNSNGVFLENTATGVIIGGTSAGAGNLISGNSYDAIELFYCNDVVISGNVIGPAANLEPAFGAQRHGVDIYQSSGATVTGNKIAYCNIAVALDGNSVRNRFSRNEIYANAFGIDLAWYTNPGHTPNDPCDADGGENLFLNSPVLSSATSSAGSTVVVGALESEPDGAYTIEFFWSPACNASGYGEGRTFLGSVAVTTDPSCHGSFVAELPVGVPQGAVLTATTIDAYGGTSEFSACAPVVASAAAGFYTLAPCRVIDTRDPDGVRGGPILGGNSRRDFLIAGTCGIPPKASVIASNVTVTQSAEEGYLKLFASTGEISNASTLTFQSGRTLANNAIVALGGGAVSVVNGSSGSTHVIVDVVGYFR